MRMNNTALWTLASVLVGAYVLYEALCARRKASADEKGRDTARAGERAGEEHSSNVYNQEREAEAPAHEQFGQEPAGAENAGEESDAEASDASEEVDAGVQYDNDERARQALEARQQEQAANPQRLNAWKQKGVVGTKKAKSLARRDQRRAYYEYMRQEAERKREQLMIEEQMFGDLIEEEREERAARIAEAKQKLDEENRARRAREQEERRLRNERRTEIEQELANRGLTKLSNDDDIEIAEDISSAIVLENGDYAVVVTSELVGTLTAALTKKGSISMDEIQNELLKKVYS